MYHITLIKCIIVTSKFTKNNSPATCISRFYSIITRARMLMTKKSLKYAIENF